MGSSVGEKLKKSKTIIIIIWMTLVINQNVWAVNPLVKARTIGELVITLFAGAGTAFTSPTVVPAIYQAYDVEAYDLEHLVQNGILTVDGVSSSDAVELIGTNPAFNLDEMAFRTLMENNWQTMIDNNMDTVLRFNNIANTDSTYGAIDNLGQIVRNVANNGYLTFENSIAIVANPGSAVQVGLGNIKESILRTFGGYIRTGLPAEYYTPDIVRQAMNNGKNIAYSYYGGYAMGGEHLITYAIPKGDINFKVASRTGQYAMPCYVYNNTNTDISYDVYVYQQESKRQYTHKDYTIVPRQRKNINEGYIGNWGMPDASRPTFDTIEDVDAYFSSTDEYVPYSNFLVDTQGNITEDSIPQSQVPQDGGIQIIPSDEYTPYVNQVKENTDDNDPTANGPVTNNFINNYIVTPAPPTPIPSITVIPPQPTIDPKPTLTPAEIAEGLELTGTDKIKEIFPFCIPFDLAKIFTKFTANRRAPQFTFELNSEIFGYLGEIDLDLSRFDAVATLLRSLELILFVVLLAVGTRNLIGARG